MNLSEINEIGRLVERHRRQGLLLDANLLVLLVVGAVDRRRIRTHRRTADSYTLADFDLLWRFCELFPRLMTLPHVLTEASDLLRREDEQLWLKVFIDRCEEKTVSSRDAAAAPEFPHLGLADAAILECSSQSPLVLTDDGPLTNAVLERGGAALSFDWLRPFG